MNIEEKADMGITISEKAKQYADKPTHSRYQKDRRLKFESYKDGYTQAITDLSAENEKLREALRELIKESEEYVIPDADRANSSQYDHYIEIDDFKSLVTKAKLITEEK